MPAPTNLPFPPSGWPQMLTQALNSIVGSLVARIGDLEAKRTVAGKMGLSITALKTPGEVACNGAIYSKKGLPELYRAIGNTFNTGGETADQFRVPNIASGSANYEWRISTGVPI